MVDNDSKLFSVDIENFKGPLEILLDLAKAQKVKLEEISITRLADQFHDYICNEKKANLENLDKEELDYSVIKETKLYNKYTPLDVFKINEIFQKNEDIFLVTDKTQNFQKIINDFQFSKERILVEVFGKKNFYKSVKEGILNPIYSFNHKDLDFVLSNKIKIIAAHTRNIIENPNIYKTLMDNDVFIFAYTSNNETFIKKNLGINFTNIYTDFWNIKKMKCTSSKNCNTY